MDGHKKKKPTKAELQAIVDTIMPKEEQEKIPKFVESEIKGGHIKNMMIGYQVANQMLLDYINNHHTIDEVKAFVEKNVSKDGVETMEKVIGGNYNEI